jgi:hypothetical protein
MREPRRSTWDGAPRRPPVRDEWSTGEDRCEHASPCSWRLGVAACSDRSKAGRRAETGENEDEAQDPVARRRTWRLPAAARLPGSTSCIIRIDFRHRTRCRNAQQAPLHRPAFLLASCSRPANIGPRCPPRMPSVEGIATSHRAPRSRGRRARGLRVYAAIWPVWGGTKACQTRGAGGAYFQSWGNPFITGGPVWIQTPKWGAPQGRLLCLDKAQALPDPGGAPRRVA